MKISVIVCLLLIGGALSQGFIKDPSAKPLVKTTLPMVEDLPVNYTWSDVNGTNYLTLVRNQHIPVYCGSCWTFSTTSALSDRIKILRNAQWPDIDLAPQVIISCDGNDQGCDGGDPLNAYAYMNNYSISDETCTVYQARGWTNGIGCDQFIRCGTCDPNGNCAPPTSYLIYNVTEYGVLTANSTTAMQNEIYQRGPISCVIDAGPLLNYTGGIINVTGPYTTDHAVSVVGWGTTEDGTPYWIVRNSWGSYWGEYGFFRIVAGQNILGIESYCTYGVPGETWVDGARNYTNSSEIVVTKKTISRKIETAINKFLPLFTDERTAPQTKTCYKPNPKYNRTFDPETAPWSHIKDEDVPVNFTWQNVNGINYLSWHRNQHIPQYCGSCWAQAATSAIADRINILRNWTNITVSISSQAIIDCDAGGDCNGGDSMGVYEFASSHGVPEDSCMAYEAMDPPKEDCSPILVCKTCQGPPPPPGPDTEENCTAVTDYPNWKVSSYGSVSGAANMQKAILANGPISCGMDVTNQFEAYTGGIYKQFVLVPMLNHEVSVVGWGTTADGQSYWIVRNSWGTFWGEWGFFRIQMGSQNLGIETQCSWAIPIVDQ